MPDKSELDLTQVFKAVSQTMVQNQTSLNEADSYNHDHGDNMVQIFKLVTKVMGANKDAAPSDQMTLAAKQLETKLDSGSAKLYADGFSRAAQQFEGQKTISPENMFQLVQLLMGTGQAQAPQSAQETAQPDANPLGSLLGTLGANLLGQSDKTLQTQPNQTAGGLGIENLISAGMAFFQSQQQGESPFESVVDAIMAGSQMGSSQERAQSGKLIANTIMQLAGPMLQK